MSVLTPLPGRECGSCTSCCVELAIDAPDLTKPDGCECPHLIAGAGCGIYADRPALCRNWYCGWRMGALSEAMRPDRSGVLLIPELGRTEGYRKGGLRLVLTGGDRGQLALCVRQVQVVIAAKTRNRLSQAKAKSGCSRGSTQRPARSARNENGGASAGARGGASGAGSGTRSDAPPLASMGATVCVTETLAD